MSLFTERKDSNVSPEIVRVLNGMLQAGKAILEGVHDRKESLSLPVTSSQSSLRLSK